MFKKIVALVTVIAFASLTTPISSYAQALKVSNGTPVILRLTEEVSSKTKNINDMVNLEVARDVVIDGKTVIAAGTPAKGTVTMIEKTGMIGKAGKVQVMVESTKTVDGQNVPLRATLTNEGKDNMMMSVVLGVVCCLLFLLMSGKDAVATAGSEIKAYTETDLSVVGK